MRLFLVCFLTFISIFSGSLSLAADGDYEIYGSGSDDVNGLYVFVNFGDYSKDNKGKGPVPIYQNGSYWLTHRGCVLEWIIIKDDGPLAEWNACWRGEEFIYGSTAAGELVGGSWYPPEETYGPCAYDATVSPMPYPTVAKAAPPTPATMSFDTNPYDTSTTAIRMVATQASDPSGGVRYHFDFVSSPTGGSGGSDYWTYGRTYTDNGLRPNHQYRYRVRARDKYYQWNNYSPTVATYTDIEAPSGISFGTITTNSIQVRSTNTPSGLTRGSSGLILYNTTSNTNSGWKQDNDYWNCSKLAINTNYAFRARARNGDGDNTGYCTHVYRYTLANTPGTSSFSNVTETSIRANWTANGNPADTQYYCQNTTLGTNSGWTTDTSWNSTGMTCGSAYTFRVRARNGNNIVTSWQNLGTRSTQACPGVLAVTPMDGLNASGFVGGPFDPSSRDYTLLNSGGTAIDWTASKNEAWVGLSQTSGTLNAGQSTTVSVSINSDADALSPDTYSDTVTFTNTTNGSGDTTRPVSLTVSPLPGDLVVTPLTGLTSTGVEGGPFDPSSETYTLNNAGGSSLDWTASKTTSWVSLSDTSGTLTAGASTTVTVSINTDADSLSPNTYLDTIIFTDSTNNEQSTRPVSLTVDPNPGSLAVSPSGATNFSGMQGGPFSPASATFTLENTGGVPIDWSIANTQAWLDIAPTSGTLDAGESVDMTVSVNSTADSLAPADHADTLTFTNTTNGSGDTSRTVNLRVQGEIVLGQMDDFEDETTRNWFFGSDNGPSAGTPTLGSDTITGNKFLLVDADGSNMDGKLVIQNDNQWSGDWSAAGIKNIEMDLKNLSAHPLEMRLALVNVDEDGNMTGGCTSTVAESVAPNSVDWQHVSFAVEASDFSCSLEVDIIDLLADVSMLRLLHNTDTDYNGEAIVAQLGVDNLTAIAYRLGITIDPLGAGDVRLDPTGGVYGEDEQVTLTAEPFSGWRFSQWSGDLSGTNNPEYLTMDANKAISAAFESLGDFSLAVSVEPQDVGTVTLDPDGGSYVDGTVVKLTAVSSDPYYECGSWTVDGQDVTDPNQACELSVTMDANKTVITTFVAKDSDNDGISDQEEDGSPTGPDCNGDGTPDKEQANVVSLKTVDGQHYLTLVSESGTKLSSCRSASNPDSENTPDWAQFQFGFFEFTIENLVSGGSTIVEIIFPTNLAQGVEMPNSYYKYGPTPDDQTPHWYRFKYEEALGVGAQFEDNVIQLHLIDNALGDDDSTAGVITDIGGPALVDNSSGNPKGGPSGGGSPSSGGGGGGCFISFLSL
jgi:hypothetical protein